MAFTVNRAGAGGLTYEQTRRRSLHTPTRGVRRAVEDDSWEDHVCALALVLPGGAAFSHFTAAQLLNLPLPQLNNTPLDVTVRSRSARGTRREVAWHHTKSPFQTAHVRALPVTDVARTWLDLGGALDLPWQVAVTDVVLQRLRVDELIIPARRRGAANLSAAVALANPRSRSARESLLRVHLILAGAPAPEVNLDLVEDGVWLATGDLVWPEYRLVLEYDGVDHASLRQRHKDANTRGALSAHGWTVQPLTAIHFQYLDRTVTMVLDLLRAKGWRC